MNNHTVTAAPDLATGGDVYVQPSLLKWPPRPKTSCIYLVEHAGDALEIACEVRTHARELGIIAPRFAGFFTDTGLRVSQALTT